uniref:Anoctamin transmembrane domain-containing protein n=1 Tax=Chromera velia CCMP2878 TaxID=1169474 RepID=A0A0G4I993_9ALVE|eukprot:Cvel_12078.t1-p1 / transcript=Cvel_12078.t1 / gene=Cvel_12078 / organism=Chromera_velia_CCMP2878 / gene_product=Anoctamin-10, putative / transcript_product=Anoctamin-10, putative / location=Cvel_scaffold777:23450-38036(-) / protein_length=2108 / sequence_SO=supercontig / SO=protein_coding / is_pseudo=false
MKDEETRRNSVLKSANSSFRHREDALDPNGRSLSVRFSSAKNKTEAAEHASQQWQPNPPLSTPHSFMNLTKSAKTNPNDVVQVSLGAFNDEQQRQRERSGPNFPTYVTGVPVSPTDRETHRLAPSENDVKLAHRDAVLYARGKLKVSAEEEEQERMGRQGRQTPSPFNVPDTADSLWMQEELEAARLHDSLLLQEEENFGAKAPGANNPEEDCQKAFSSIVQSPETMDALRSLSPPRHRDRADGEGKAGEKTAGASAPLSSSMKAFVTCFEGTPLGSIFKEAIGVDEDEGDHTQADKAELTEMSRLPLPPPEPFASSLRAHSAFPSSAAFMGMSHLASSSRDRHGPGGTAAVSSALRSWPGDEQREREVDIAAAEEGLSPSPSPLRERGGTSVSFAKDPLPDGSPPENERETVAGLPEVGWKRLFQGLPPTEEQLHAMEQREHLGSLSLSASRSRRRQQNANGRSPPAASPPSTSYPFPGSSPLSDTPRLGHSPSSPPAGLADTGHDLCEIPLEWNWVLVFPNPKAGGRVSGPPSVTALEAENIFEKAFRGEELYVDGISLQQKNFTTEKREFLKAFAELEEAGDKSRAQLIREQGAKDQLLVEALKTQSREEEARRQGNAVASALGEHEKDGQGRPEWLKYETLPPRLWAKEETSIVRTIGTLASHVHMEGGEEGAAVNEAEEEGGKGVQEEEAVFAERESGEKSAWKKEQGKEGGISRMPSRRAPSLWLSIVRDAKQEREADYEPAADFLSLIRNVIVTKLAYHLKLSAKKVFSSDLKYVYLLVGYDTKDVSLAALRHGYPTALDLTVTDFAAFEPCTKEFVPLCEIFFAGAPKLRSERIARLFEAFVDSLRKRLVDCEERWRETVSSSGFSLSGEGFGLHTAVGVHLRRALWEYHYFRSQLVVLKQIARVKLMTEMEEEDRERQSVVVRERKQTGGEEEGMSEDVRRRRFVKTTEESRVDALLVRTRRNDKQKPKGGVGGPGSRDRAGPAVVHDAWGVVDFQAPDDLRDMYQKFLRLRLRERKDPYGAYMTATGRLKKDAHASHEEASEFEDSQQEAGEFWSQQNKIARLYEVYLMYRKKGFCATRAMHFANKGEPYRLLEFFFKRFRDYQSEFPRVVQDVNPLSSTGEGRDRFQFFLKLVEEDEAAGLLDLSIDDMPENIVFQATQKKNRSLRKQQKGEELGRPPGLPARVALLKLVKFRESSKKYALKNHFLQLGFKYSLRSTRVPYTEEIPPAALTQFPVSHSDLWTTTPPPPLCSCFSPVDRLRLVRDLMTRNIDFTYLISKKLLLDFFPLPDENARRYSDASTKTAARVDYETFVSAVEQRTGNATPKGTTQLPVEIAIREAQGSGESELNIGSPSAPMQTHGGGIGQPNAPTTPPPQGRSAPWTPLAAFDELDCTLTTKPKKRGDAKGTASENESDREAAQWTPDSTEAPRIDEKQGKGGGGVRNQNAGRGGSRDKGTRKRRKKRGSCSCKLKGFFEVVFVERNTAFFFGEGIGLYFAFLRHFVLWMAVPAAYGVVFQILLFIFPDRQSSFNQILTVTNACCLTFWSTVWLSAWQRRERRYMMECGFPKSVTFNYPEPPRLQAYGHPRRSPVTDEPGELFFPLSQLRWRLGVTAFVSVLFSLLPVSAIFFIEWLKYWSFQERWLFYLGYDFSSVAGGILSAIQINVFNFLYEMLALEMTDWENHQDFFSFRYAFATKICVFKCFNTYAGLVWIGFLKARFQVPCTGGDCATELQTSLLFLMLSLAAFNAVELGVPFAKGHIMAYCRKRRARRAEQRKKKAAEAASTSLQEDSTVEGKDQKGLSGEGDLEAPDEVKKESDPAAERRKEAMRELVKQIDLQMNLDPYGDPRLDFDGTLREYLEILIAYGFLVLFSIAFPASGLLQLVVNALEVYVDYLKLHFLVRRPHPHPGLSVGIWLNIFGFVGGLMNQVGVFVNAALLVWTYGIDSLVRDDDGSNMAVGSFLAFALLFWGLRAVAAILFGDTDLNVVTLSKRISVLLQRKRQPLKKKETRRGQGKDRGQGQGGGESVRSHRHEGNEEGGLWESKGWMAFNHGGADVPASCMWGLISHDTVQQLEKGGAGGGQQCAVEAQGAGVQRVPV